MVNPTGPHAASGTNAKRVPTHSSVASYRLESSCFSAPTRLPYVLPFPARGAMGDAVMQATLAAKHTDYMQHMRQLWREAQSEAESAAKHIRVLDLGEQYENGRISVICRTSAIHMTGFDDIWQYCRSRRGADWWPKGDAARQFKGSLVYVDCWLYAEACSNGETSSVFLQGMVGTWWPVVVGIPYPVPQSGVLPYTCPVLSRNSNRCWMAHVSRLVLRNLRAVAPTASPSKSSTASEAPTASLISAPAASPIKSSTASEAPTQCGSSSSSSSAPSSINSWVAPSSISWAAPSVANGFAVPSPAPSVVSSVAPSDSISCVLVPSMAPSDASSAVLVPSSSSAPRRRWGQRHGRHGA